jgi:hypothetical protein
MKRIIPIFALATAATLASPPSATSATARPAVRSVAPVAEIQVPSWMQLSNGKWRYWFDGSASYDPDGTITSYHWQPDGACLAAGTYSTTTYMDIPDGQYCSIVLTVTDNSSSTDTDVMVIVGGW